MINKINKKFDELLNHDDPNGQALVLISSDDGSVSQKPAQNIIKDFIQNEVIPLVIKEVIDLTDVIEAQHNSSLDEWKGFKGVRNTLRAKYLKE